MLAVQSAESGRWGIYVVRLSDNRRIVISTSGAEHPRWTRSGLYFQSRGALMHARISDAETLRVEDVTSGASLQSGTLRGSRKTAGCCCSERRRRPAPRLS